MSSIQNKWLVLWLRGKGHELAKGFTLKDVMEWLLTIDLKNKI